MNDVDIFPLWLVVINASIPSVKLCPSLLS